MLPAPQFALVVKRGLDHASRRVQTPTMNLWRQNGACRGLDPAIFYPLDDGMQVPYWFWHLHMWSTTWI